MLLAGAFLWMGLGAASALAIGPHERLEGIAEEAAALPAPAPLYLKNIKVGTRGVVYTDISIAPSNPESIYVASAHGYVFSSHDGGVTWTEARLVVRRRPFFGTIRPSSSPGGAPFSVQENISDLQGQGMMKFNTADLLRFPYGTTGEPYLELDPNSPAFWSAVESPGFGKLSLTSMSDGAGAGGGSVDLARLGVGLKTSAPWLARLLRKKGKRLLTMNLQLLLAMKGREPTHIAEVAVHPTDHNRVFAASLMGLWRSTDGGSSWVLAFPGSTHRERQIHHVAFHPLNPDMLFLSTGEGVRVSMDGGDTFQPIKGTQLSSARSHWIHWSDSQPDVLVAGSNIGAFLSEDRGRTWRWIYYETLPTQNHVSGVAVDPLDPNRITLGTKDGMFHTRDGGLTWKRAGGVLFTGTWVRRVVVHPNNGDHLLAITWRNVWQSRDWGKTWSVVYVNDSEWFMRTVEFDVNDPEVFWVVTSGEMLRISGKPPSEPDPIGLQLYKARLAKEPTLPHAIDSALKHFRVHTGERVALRQRASTSALLPRVNLMAGAVRATGDAALRLALYNDPARDPSNGLVPILARDETYFAGYAFMTLKWNLGSAVLDLDQIPFGRVFGTANWTYLELKYQVQRLYEERRRLLLKLLTTPPANPRAYMFMKLRLEELTIQLNVYTGGDWEEPVAWIESLP